MIPIKIISQDIYKELSTSPINWLLANVGDKLRIETTFAAQNYAITTVESPMIFNNTNGMVGVGWVQDTNAQGQFANFSIGDTVTVFSQTAMAIAYTKTIIDKIDNNNIQFDSVIGGGNNLSYTDVIISSTVPIVAVKYHFNFIENSSADTFLSIFDGSEQIIVIKNKAASDTTPEAMEYDGASTWQSGSAVIEGVSIDDGTTDGVYKSIFKITQYITVPPFLIVDQIEDQIAGIPYKDFKTDKCWKFIYQIEAAEVYTNPNFLLSDVIDTVVGNSGWYNENFNTGLTNYSISGKTYKNAGQTIDGIQFDATETTLTFFVNNPTDTPFSDGNTQFVAGVFKVPNDETEYQNNLFTLDQNFCFDRALQTLGSAAVTGDNFGTDYQVISSLKATFISSSIIKVEINFLLTAVMLAKFQESAAPRYFIYLSTQNYLKDTSDAFNDLVTLQVDLGGFTVHSNDPFMIIPSNVFIRHPEVDPATEGVQLGFGRNSTVNQTITLSNANSPLSLNYIDNKLYISNIGGNVVDVYNSLTQAFITQIVGFNAPNFGVFDPINKRIYLSNGSGSNIKVIDCATDTIIATIAVGSHPFGGAYNPINKSVYIVNNISNTVSVIDTITNTLTTSIAVGAGPLQVAYNSLSNTMYITNRTANSISVIDCSLNTILTTIALTAGDHPISISYCSVMDRIYVTCNSLNLARIIQCSDNTILPDTITGIDGSAFSTYNPIDNQMIYSPIAGDSLIIINCFNNDVFSTINIDNFSVVFDIVFDSTNYQIISSFVNNKFIFITKCSFDVFPEDEIVCCSNFYIESATRTTDIIKLTSVIGKIIVTDGSNEFELDGFAMQLSSAPLTGYTQQFDSQIARAFHIPAGTIRKYIEVKRRNDLDTGTRKYFSSNYPILFRWEDWTAILGVDPSFFNTVLPNNGFNAWWFHYATGNWSIKYKLIVNATKNGTPQQFVLRNKIIPHDYNSNADWTVKKIETFDPDTLTSLSTGGNTYVQTFKDTLIKATFTKSTLPTGYNIVFGVEIWQQGGIYGRRRFSSKWVADSDTWFKSINNDGKIDLSIASNTVTAKALLDFTQLPSNITALKLTARIYDSNVGSVLTTDDGVPITTDGGITITID